VKRFFGLLAIIIVTTLGLALFTDTESDGHGNTVSTTRVLDIPVVSINSSGGEPAIVSIGGPGVGVLYLGVAGAGVVAIGAVGAGLLFGIGQGATGLLSIGQLSLGILFSLGQMAVGASALGQLALGWRTKGQGSESREGWVFIKSLNAELESALRFDWRGKR
jgi:PPE-repeat protein